MEYNDLVTGGRRAESALDIHVYVDKQFRSPEESDRPMYTVYLYDVGDNNKILEERFFKAAIDKTNDIFNSFIQHEGKEITPVSEIVRVIITRIPNIIFENCCDYLRNHKDMDYFKMELFRVSPRITYKLHKTPKNSMIIEFVNAVLNAHLDFSKESNLLSKKKEIIYKIKGSIIPLSFTGSRGKQMTVFEMAKKQNKTVLELVKSLLTDYAGTFDEDLEKIANKSASELRELFLN